jgi:biotin transport system substrate-specific component
MKTKDLVQVALIASILFVLSFIKFHIGTVPITLQTFGVMLAGSVFGSKKGGLATLVYLIVYVLLGYGNILGPTGGFLVSFPIAAFLIGLAIEKTNNSPYTIFYINTLFGVLLVYAIGVPWLMNVLEMDLGKALTVAAYPFIPGDMIKVVLTAIISPKLITELKKINH